MNYLNNGLDFSELRKQPHWSFSSLNQVLNICSQQYAFRKIEKLKPTFLSSNLVFGSAFHKAMSFIYLAKKNDEKILDDDIADFFVNTFEQVVKGESLPIQFPDKKDFDWHLEKGIQMLEVIVTNLDPDDEVLGVDVPFIGEFRDSQGQVFSKRFIGEFDTLMRNKDRIIVVDFKTSASKWAENKCHSDLQATIYLMALRQQTSKPSLFRYDVITKTKTPTITKFLTDRTNHDFQRLSKMVQMADRVVRNNLYYPHDTGFYCGGCGYKGKCAEWHLQSQLELAA